MTDCKIDLTNLSDERIAERLRKIANQYDQWPPIRNAAIAFIMGCIFIASLDYGDVWICVGQCGNLENVE